MEERITYIYALLDPRNNEVRYVGKTVNPKVRYNGHCNPSPNNQAYSAKWIRSISPLRPEMIILEEVSTSWIEAEQFWIGYVRSLGARLTNLSDGGEGVLGIVVSEVTRFKMSVAQKGRLSPMKNKRHSEETLRIMSEVKLGKLKSAETKIRMSMAQTGRVVTDATREKISVATKAAMNTPEMFERMSKARTGRTAWNKGIFGPSGQKRSDETRAVLSEKAKLREQRKRESNYTVSAETRQKLSEVNKRAMQRRKEEFLEICPLEKCIGVFE